jgi:hypothetical protein
MIHATPCCNKAAMTGIWIRIWLRLSARQAIPDLPSVSPPIWHHSNSQNKSHFTPHYVLAPHQGYMRFVMLFNFFAWFFRVFAGNNQNFVFAGKKSF